MGGGIGPTAFRPPGRCPPTPDRSPEPIAFAAPEDPGALNPSLLWEKGSSPGSRFDLAGGALTLTAGAQTWPGFPAVIYPGPLSGSFDAQVKAVFRPPRMEILTAQMVGLLVRPVNARLVRGMERFPLNWMIASKQLADTGQMVGCRPTWDDYPADAVYLRIERDAESWRCARGSGLVACRRR